MYYYLDLAVSANAHQALLQKSIDRGLVLNLVSTAHNEAERIWSCK